LTSKYLKYKYEENEYKASSFKEKIDFWKDKITLNLADLILVDTPSNLEWFAETFNVSKEKFQVKYIGESTNIFKPLPLKKSTKTFNVLFLLTFRPMHNVAYVLKAAKKLSSKNVNFILVGRGPTKQDSINFVKKENIKNIKFVDWVGLDRLNYYLANSDVCLGGPFSSSQRSNRVVTSKTFNALASQRAVIVGNTMQNKLFFKNHEDAAVFVDITNPNSLSDAIIDLKKNKAKREKIAKNGYKFFKENFSLEKIGHSLKKRFELLLN